MVAVVSVNAVIVDWTNFIPFFIPATFVNVDTVIVNTNDATWEETGIAYANKGADGVVTDVIVAAVVTFYSTFVDVVTCRSGVVSVASEASFAFAVKVAFFVDTISKLITVVMIVSTFVVINTCSSVTDVTVDAVAFEAAFSINTLCQFVTIVIKGGALVCIDTYVCCCISDKSDWTVASLFAISNSG